MNRPVRIAVVNDYEVVVAGLAAALEPYADRVKVVELDSQRVPVSDVDVVLYDSFGQDQGHRIDLERLLAGSRGAHVVVFSWNVQPDLVDEALARGAAGYLSKELEAARLVELIEKIAEGVVVRPAFSAEERAQLALADEEPALQLGSWPGREHGLTPRESEMVALITQGLSNKEIAARAYLSINSVKTHVRTAYAKIGARNRAQAVTWGMQHGFQPDRSREVLD